jgi:hypothetical protein
MAHAGAGSPRGRSQAVLIPVMSAVPALDGDTRSAQSLPADSPDKASTRSEWVDRQQLSGTVRCQRGRRGKSQLINEQAAARAGDGLSGPVRHKAVPKVGMNQRAGGSITTPFVRLVLVVAQLSPRDEPVPVQDRHVGVKGGRRMPAQQVMVIQAHFAWTIVVADVVIIRLRQRYVNDAEDQHSDPQRPHRSSESPLLSHVRVSHQEQNTSLVPLHRSRKECGPRKSDQTSMHYGPWLLAGQARRRRP